ncbi:uncharacterized protein LOC144105133 [Amblyomma americanum]
MCDKWPPEVSLYFKDAVWLQPRQKLVQLHYPELRSDLQQYQDTSQCYPDVGEWVLVYRNYYFDADFAGAEKCVKYERFGVYENFTTPCIFLFGPHGSNTGSITLSSSPCYTAKNQKSFVPEDDNVPAVEFHTIYMNCASCFVARHPYAANGYGCTLWRRYDSLNIPDVCCEFIYDENCGTSPKYHMYHSTCTWNPPTNP